MQSSAYVLLITVLFYGPSYIRYLAVATLLPESSSGRTKAEYTSKFLSDAAPSHSVLQAQGVRRLRYVVHSGAECTLRFTEVR